MATLYNEEGTKTWLNLKRIENDKGEKIPFLFSKGVQQAKAVRGNLTKIALKETESKQKKDGTPFNVREFHLYFDDDTILSLNYLSESAVVNTICAKLMNLTDFEDIALVFYYFKGKTQVKLESHGVKINPSYGMSYTDMPDNYEATPAVFFVDAEGNTTKDKEAALKDSKGYFVREQKSLLANEKFYLDRLLSVIELVNSAKTPSSDQHVDLINDESIDSEDEANVVNSDQEDTENITRKLPF